VWISRVQHPDQIFDSCDNERKHGGVTEPIRRFTSDVNVEEEGEELTN
jgi:hypothetical protein